jgi:UDP-N-acetylmuramate--alanine ligase
MKQFAKKIHMAGIGGAGMNPIAELLHSLGHTVTGSDKACSAATIRLESMGIKVQYSHEPVLVRDAEILVYSSAVREDNPERIFARENNITEIRRAEMLGELMRAQYAVCISGTHGKTTTTTLTGTIFHDAGLAPTVLAGGLIKSTESNALIGKGNYMIAEADEYDRSFLAMYPSLAIITNIEADHLDCYGDLESIRDAFVKFTDRLPFYGAVIVCKDDPGVRDILGKIQRTCITYGISEKADYTAQNISFSNGKPSFTVMRGGSALGEVTLNIPGIHNVSNSLASIAAATELGIPFESIKSTLRKFQGVGRRFEIVGEEKGVTIVDDYAHHPGEIRATLDAARRSGYRRVIAVFQPHLYTRTRDFMDGFAQSLAAADSVIVTDIYKAREEPIAGVSSKTMVEKIKLSGHDDAVHIPDSKDVVAIIKSKVKNGDVVVVMGAGDIWQIAARCAEELRNG